MGATWLGAEAALQGVRVDGREGKRKKEDTKRI